MSVAKPMGTGLVRPVHQHGPVRSILFVELLGGLGDLLLALPAIHALARSHPGARLTVLTFPPGDSLLASDPHVHEVVRATPGPKAQEAALARMLRRGFDLVVSDTRYGNIPTMLERSDAPQVVSNLWRNPSSEERIDLRFLRLLAEDGVIEPSLRALQPQVVLTVGERVEGRAMVAALLLCRRRRVLLLPEAGMGIKEWAPGRFRALAARLVADGYAILVATGTRPDLAASIAHGLRHAAVLPPRPLRQLAAAAAACAAVVGGDTGPARLAAAVGTPTVALYGPTWAGRFGLRPDHVSLQSPLPCDVRNPANMTEQECWYSGRCVFEHLRTCTDELGLDQVHAAVRRLLDHPRP